MLMKNPTDHTVSISDLKLAFAPGETHEVPDALCLPRLAQNGYKLKSIVEMLAPQLVPADPATADAFKKNELDPAPMPQTGPMDYVSVAGMPPALRALVAEGADSVPPPGAKRPPTPKQQAQQAAVEKAPSRPAVEPIVKFEGNP